MTQGRNWEVPGWRTVVVPERLRRGTVGWVTASCTWPGWQGRMHWRRESPCAVAAPIWEEGVEVVLKMLRGC